MQNYISSKKSIIILFLLCLISFAILPTNKIFAQNSDVQKIVGENTPEYITKPIMLTYNFIEKFRSNMSIVADSKKESVRGEINALNNANISSDSIGQVSKFLKSFKYVQLYFFSLLSIIFSTKLVFYGICVFIIFLVLRYILHLIL